MEAFMIPRQGFDRGNGEPLGFKGAIQAEALSGLAAPFLYTHLAGQLDYTRPFDFLRKEYGNGIR
jgi:hypothetical protein